MPIKAVLLDLGGVVYVGDSLLPGAARAIARLRSEGFALCFVSNVTRQSAASLRTALQSMGLVIGDDPLLTPALAARGYIERNGLRPHLLVHPRLEEDFSDVKEGETDAVIIGDAGGLFAYENLNRAFRVLNRGAPLVALAANKVFRDADGKLSLDAGAFVTALSFASGVEPVVLGKPSGDFFRLALDAAGCDPGEAVMIGDDVESDIGGALAAGIRGILVRTGKYQDGAEKLIDPPPTLVVEDLPAAVEWICANREAAT